jgi:hypothetical protein
MSDEYIGNGWSLKQRIIEQQYGAAWVTPNGVNILVLQGPDHHLGARDPYGITLSINLGPRKRREFWCDCVQFPLRAGLFVALTGKRGCDFNEPTNGDSMIFRSKEKMILYSPPARRLRRTIGLSLQC